MAGHGNAPTCSISPPDKSTRTGLIPWTALAMTCRAEQCVPGIDSRAYASATRDDPHPLGRAGPGTRVSMYEDSDVSGQRPPGGRTAHWLNSQTEARGDCAGPENVMPPGAARQAPHGAALESQSSRGRTPARVDRHHHEETRLHEARARAAPRRQHRPRPSTGGPAPQCAHIQSIRSELCRGGPGGGSY
jgi:hypothetical protein